MKSKKLLFSLVFASLTLLSSLRAQPLSLTEVWKGLVLYERCKFVWPRWFPVENSKWAMIEVIRLQACYTPEALPDFELNAVCKEGGLYAKDESFRFILSDNDKRVPQTCEEWRKEGRYVED